jgi:hypothetical protein
MQNAAPRAPEPSWRRTFLGSRTLAGGAAFAGALLVLLGVKLWLIRTYANGTPFWDQWDAEAAKLLEPYLHGTLGIRDLLAAHNEHRILFTRLFTLLLFELNGLWSPTVETTANSFLHVGGIGLLTLLAWRAVGRSYLPFLLAVALCLFLVPYGFENTLFGFQSQFYFAMIFSFGALWLLAVPATLGPAWCAGIFLAAMAYFSLASGVFAFAAGAATLAVRGVLRGGDHRTDLAGAAVLLALSALCVHFIPVLAHHADLRSPDVSAFAGAAVRGLAWPFEGPVAALLRNAPLLLFLASMLRSRPQGRDPRWFLFALALWCLGQEASLAFGRFQEVLAPRYMDLHVVSLFANAAALAALLLAAGKRSLWLPAAVWLIACIATLAVGLASGELAMRLEETRTMTSRQEENLRTYLSGGDRATFLAQPHLALPYPSAERLAGMLDSPTLRAVLPTHLQAPIMPVAMSGQDFGFPGVPPTAASCDCRSTGSFGPSGNADVGEARIKYVPAASTRGDARLSLLVAGLPSRGAFVEVLQDGRSRRLHFEGDPGERWVRVSVSIRNRPFELRITDNAADGWIAVSDPVPTGRLEAAAERLLHYGPGLVLLGLGLMALGLLSWLAPVGLRPGAGLTSGT